MTSLQPKFQARRSSNHPIKMMLVLWSYQTIIPPHIVASIIGCGGTSKAWIVCICIIVCNTTNTFVVFGVFAAACAVQTGRRCIWCSGVRESAASRRWHCQCQVRCRLFPPHNNTTYLSHKYKTYTSGENICKYTTSRVELNASRVTFQIQTKWKFFIRNVKGQLVPPGNMFVNIEITLEISMMQLNSQNVSKTFLALKRDSSPKRTFPKLDCMSNVRTLPRVGVFRVILNILVHLLGGNTV